ERARNNSRSAAVARNTATRQECWLGPAGAPRSRSRRAPALWYKLRFISVGGRMKRRDLIAGLLPVAVAPLAGAQQSGMIYRIAAVHSTHPPSLMSEHGGLSYWQALFQELRRLGYEEGRNLKIERYSERGQEEISPALAKQIVATQPDLIFSL